MCPIVLSAKPFLKNIYIYWNESRGMARFPVLGKLKVQHQEADSGFTGRTGALSAPELSAVLNAAPGLQ